MFRYHFLEGILKNASDRVPMGFDTSQTYVNTTPTTFSPWLQELKYSHPVTEDALKMFKGKLPSLLTNTTVMHHGYLCSSGKAIT